MKKYRSFIGFLMAFFIVMLAGCHGTHEANETIDAQTDAVREETASEDQAEDEKLNEGSSLIIEPKLRIVAAGFKHVVGLKSDGTMLAVGDNEKGQCNVELWENIIEVAAGSNFTAGLQSNGTVITTDETII